MDSQRLGSCLAVLLCTISSASAEEHFPLRFDKSTEPILGPLLTAQDAQIEWLRDGLRVTTGREHDWPGITVRSPAGNAADVSGFTDLVVKLRNPSADSVKVFCRVDNPGADGKDHCLTGQISLPPNVTRDLVLPLTEKMPAGLQSKLFGMRGVPGPWRRDAGIDPSQVTQILLFVHQPERKHTFDVIRIRGAGERGARPPTEEAKLFPLIDRYGQYRHKTWPGKTTSDADLARQRGDEETDLQRHTGPSDWDRYGGWQEGPLLEATGRFRIAQHAGRWWFVDPEGRLFWSHGADCVRATTGYTPITDREHWFAELPDANSALAVFYGRASWAPHGYYQGKSEYLTFNFTGANLRRKYGANWRDEFASLCHRRLRSWGMNTIANWSDSEIYHQRKTPYTATIGFDSVKIAGSAGYWGKFPDVFDDDFTSRLRRGMQGHQGGAAGDPWCVGYFISNELSWGDELSLALATLASPPQQAAKQVFCDDLREKYETIEALNQAWGTQHASWEALRQSTATPDRQRAADDLRAFYTKLAEKYFRTCRDVVREFDPQGLYLGCRFAWANDRAVRGGEILRRGQLQPLRTSVGPFPAPRKCRSTGRDW